MVQFKHSPPWTLGVEVVISSTCKISVNLIHIHLKTHNTSLHDFCIHALPLLLDYEIREGAATEDLATWDELVNWSFDFLEISRVAWASFTLQVCNRGRVNEWLWLGYKKRPDSGKVTYTCVSVSIPNCQVTFFPIRAYSRTVSQRIEES